MKYIHSPSLEGMMTLWCAINGFNEEHLLPECLDSIRKYNPEAKIVWVDGAYKSFINENKKAIAVEILKGNTNLAEAMEKYTIPQSTDKSLEILRNYKVDMIIPCEEESGIVKPWENECVKRSKYFVGQPGDYYLVIDADERLTKRLDWQGLTDDSYNVIVHRDDQGTVPYAVMRIHKHIDGMHYHGAHHALWMNDQLIRREMCQTLDLELYHRVEYRAVRDPLRHMAKGAYYATLTHCEEAAFRAVHKL